jgi:hypothetical protein
MTGRGVTRLGRVVAVGALIFLASVASAHGAPVLEITTGSLYGNSWGDLLYSYGGPRVEIGHSGGLLFGPMPFGDYDQTFIGVSDNPFQTLDRIVIDGEERCRSAGLPHCGNLAFRVHGPIQPPGDIDPQTSWTIEAPFTATGHLTIDEGYDLVGQGIFRLNWCPTGIGCRGFALPGYHGSFTFAVPEPSTLMVLVMGLGLSAVVVRRIRR